MQTEHIILIVAIAIGLIIGPVVAFVILHETNDNKNAELPIVTLQLSKNGTVLGSVQGEVGFVYAGEMYVLTTAKPGTKKSLLHKFTPSNLSTPAMSWTIDGVVTNFIIQQDVLFYVMDGNIYNVRLPAAVTVTLKGNLWRKGQHVLLVDPLNNQMFDQRQTFAPVYPYEATRRAESTYQAATAINQDGTLSFVTTNERNIFIVQHDATAWAVWSVVWVNTKQADIPS